MKTISDLNKTKWYRTIKVILFFISLSILIFTWIAIDMGEISDDYLWIIILIPILIEIIRRSLFYIVLGTLTPKK